MMMQAYLRYPQKLNPKNPLDSNIICTTQQCSMSKMLKRLFDIINVPILTYRLTKKCQKHLINPTIFFKVALEETRLQMRCATRMSEGTPLMINESFALAFRRGGVPAKIFTKVHYYCLSGAALGEIYLS